jgi:hypothetical protein
MASSWHRAYAYTKLILLDILLPGLLAPFVPTDTRKLVPESRGGCHNI